VRRAVFVLGVLAAVLLAGCGGSGGGTDATGDSGADFTPAGAPLYMYFNADRDSAQWNDLEALVDKFPDGDRLGQQLVESLAEEGVDYDDDVEPALGPEVALALLSFAGDTDDNFIGATKPDDDGKFEALVRKLNEDDPSDPALSRLVDGWRVIASTEGALDEAEQAHEGTSLADNDTFEEAMGELPDEALFKLYVDSAAAARGLGEDAAALSDFSWLSVAVTAAGDGIGFDSAAKISGGAPDNYRATLTDDIPEGVLFALGFKGVGGQLRDADLDQYLDAYSGISADDLANLFDGEAAFYVRSASPIPEVTLLLENSGGRLETVDRVMQDVATSTGSTIETVAQGEKELNYGGFAIRYGIFEDKVVVTTAADGIAVAGEDGDKLADDSDFRAAVDAAGMPDENAGFTYVNIEDSIPVLAGYLSAAGEPLDSDLQANLRPLKSFLAFAERDGSIVRGKGFLRID
jgi:hypothetical protein